MFDGRTYWIVGASEGLGRELARALTEAGARVILSARSEDRLREVAETLKGATIAPLDATDLQSIAKGAPDASDIDGMIYCAGVYDPMRAQDWDADKVALMFDVNLRGAVNILGRVVPAFAARDHGHVVLIGSLAGYRGLPGSIGYSASKSGLIALGESIYADLRGSGVKVQIASPGFIKTRLTDKNDFDMPQIMAPEVAAEHVMRIMRGGALHASFPRPFSWFFKWGRVLPAGIFYRLTGK